MVDYLDAMVPMEYRGACDICGNSDPLLIYDGYGYEKTTMNYHEPNIFVRVSKGDGYKQVVPIGYIEE